MARTVVALYDDGSDAQRAVRALVDSGFDRESISVLARHTEAGMATSFGNQTVEGAGIGAAIGLVFGGVSGLLVGLGVVAIPGIGPTVAAGPLIATMTGAGIGAGAGAIVGALVNLDIATEEAHIYAEGVRRGGTLVVVQVADEMVTQAANIMDRHNPADVEQKVIEWRAGGWTGFEAEDKPLEPEDEIHAPATDGQAPSEQFMQKGRTTA